MANETTTVVAHDLQPGDEIIETALGGYSGRIAQVHVSEPRHVRVVFETPGQSAYLGFWEVAVIRRAHTATVIPLRSA